jgi:hypothetical protein
LGVNFPAPVALNHFDSGVDVLMQTAAEGKLAEQNVLYGAKLKSMGFTDSAELDRRRASMAG